MSKSNSRFGSLQDIEVRKQELRQQIALQEERLGEDFDAYQEDVDTVKRMWGSVMSIRHFGKKAKDGGAGAISKISETASGLVGNGSKLSTVVTVAGKILLWAWRRKKKKNK